MTSKENAIKYTAMAIATLMQCYSLLRDDDKYSTEDPYTGETIADECKSNVDKLQEALLYFTTNAAPAPQPNTVVNYFNCKPEDYPKPTINGNVKIYTFDAEHEDEDFIELV